MQNLYILGDGGFSSEVHDCQILQESSVSHYNFIDFLSYTQDKNKLLYSSTGFDFDYPRDAAFIFGLTSRKWRDIIKEHLQERYIFNNYHFPNAISAKAHISKLSTMGIGNVIQPWVMIAGNAEIGDFNEFNWSTSISHDCKMGNDNILSPYAGIMGFGKLKDRNWFGPYALMGSYTEMGSENHLSAHEFILEGNLGDRKLVKQGHILEKPKR